MAVTDRRARITPKFATQSGRGSDADWEALFGEPVDSNILFPLVKNKLGLIFPYTPVVTQSGASASWTPQTFSHSNYPVNVWNNSDPGIITVSGLFTANSQQEARYMLAAIQFFKGAMKGGFGENDKLRGVPPPVYHFNYLGNIQFKNVPVIITDVVLDYVNDVDYVPVLINGEIEDYVPAEMNLVVTLRPQYNVADIRQRFDLKKFRTGGYLNDTGDGFL